MRSISIIDRFLEHARIIYFGQGGAGELYISSADWMPRNLDRRVELFIPVNDADCRGKLLHTLRTYFEDNQNAWRMGSDGKYERIKPGKNEKPVRSQEILYSRAVKTMRDAEQSGRTMFQTHKAHRRG